MIEINNYRFYIVDVFAKEKYTGNQLAVFRDIKGISNKKMLQIAKEVGYSETTFIISEEKRDGGYDVRIFTPEREVPFAGHPTLGTAYIIQQEIVNKHISEIVLNLEVGQIPVTFSYNKGQADILWMKQINPSFGQTLDSDLIAQVLGINKKEIDSKFPIQEVSTGLPFIIVPLNTLSTLKRISIDRDKYFELIKHTKAKIIFAFCPETYHKENDLSVRVFAYYYGVPEDPASGSGNGCLAGYLVKHRYFGKNWIDVRVEQGYEIGRPSLLFLRAEDKNGKIDIFVGGKVIAIAKGTFI
jgi:trans-2,3-dihydro-3-hydroxyanthranilate isomerase